MAPAVFLGGLDQSFNLPLRQVLAGAVFRIRFTANCALFVGWGDQFEGRNSSHFPFLRVLTMHLSHILCTVASEKGVCPLSGPPRRFTPATARPSVYRIDQPSSLRGGQLQFPFQPFPMPTTRPFLRPAIINRYLKEYHLAVASGCLPHLTPFLSPYFLPSFAPGCINPSNFFSASNQHNKTYQVRGLSRHAPWSLPNRKTVRSGLIIKTLDVARQIPRTPFVKVPTEGRIYVNAPTGNLPIPVAQ